MTLTLNRINTLLEFKDQPIVVISNRGRTAASVHMLLTKAMGFNNVRVLEGGYESWRSGGHPVQHGTDCVIINANCPWIDTPSLMCQLQLAVDQREAGDASDREEQTLNWFK